MAAGMLVEDVIAMFVAGIATVLVYYNCKGDQVGLEIEFKNYCGLKGNFRPLQLVYEGEVIEPYIESSKASLVYVPTMTFK